MRASEALENIKLIWLLIITVCSITLFILLIGLANSFENILKKEKKIDITETLSVFASGSLLFLVFNLWIYMISLYKKSLLEYLNTAGLFLAFFLSALIFHFWSSLSRRVKNKALFLRVALAILMSLLLALTGGFLFELMLRDQSFVWESWIKSSSVLFVLIFVFWFYDRFRKL